MSELKVLFTREQIARRVEQMGEKITLDYAGEKVLLVGVLKGAAVFLSDLARAIQLDATFDFISVSSYGNEKQTSGEVKLLKDVDQTLEGKHVILVEDILDTGRTLSHLRELLGTRHPNSLQICTLLSKPEARIVNVECELIGFEIPNKFVVGYGLDWNEKYRNLPEIYVLK